MRAAYVVVFVWMRGCRYGQVGGRGLAAWRASWRAGGRARGRVDGEVDCHDWIHQSAPRCAEGFDVASEHEPRATGLCLSLNKVGPANYRGKD